MENETKEQNISIVDEAKRLRDEIKAENDRRENILREEQKLQAEKMLGSSAGASIPTPEPKVETAKEYADKVMKGEVKVNDN